jgi:hypothetical protein
MVILSMKWKDTVTIAEEKYLITKRERKNGKSCTAKYCTPLNVPLSKKLRVGDIKVELRNIVESLQSFCCCAVFYI